MPRKKMTDESYIYVADLLTGIVVFSLIGWATSRFVVLHYWPLAVGIVVGVLVGVWMMVIRYRNESNDVAQKDQFFRQGVALARQKREAEKQARNAKNDKRVSLTKQDNDPTKEVAE